MRELTHKGRSWRGPAVTIDGTKYDGQFNDDRDCPVSIWVRKEQPQNNRQIVKAAK